MTDHEKDQIQRDVRRSAASRRTNPDQAILRHLGIEFYREHHRKARTSEEKTDESPDPVPPPDRWDR